MGKQILLSFDVEEFDIPEEYGQKIKEKDQISVSREGLERVLKILEKHKIKVTFFVTAKFALKNKALIKKISAKHEIASHGFYHSSLKSGDLKRSKITLDKIASKKVKGLRVPRLKKIDELEIKKAGYDYDSSMNPTFLPGRYNDFFSKRTAHYSKGLLKIPVSVTPLVRFPLFWLSFKNFPFSLIRAASKLTLENDSYLSLYFHPWEFSDISKYKVPWFVKKHSGKVMLEKLERYIVWLKKYGEFVTFSEFISSFRGD